MIKRPFVSFAVTVHDEGECIQSLINQLVPYCEHNDAELVIVDDFSLDPKTNMILDSLMGRSFVKLYFHDLNKDFAAHKNYLNSKCNGEFIFQIDADETINETFLNNLSELLTNNSTVDLFNVPRVNIVHGLTDEDIRRWGWSINDKGWNCFPDFQSRLYRNSPTIKWFGKVHERITGFRTMTTLPADEEWALYHIKDISRQRVQNEFYATI